MLKTRSAAVLQHFPSMMGQKWLKKIVFSKLISTCPQEHFEQFLLRKSKNLDFYLSFEQNFLGRCCQKGILRIRRKKHFGDFAVEAAKTGKSFLRKKSTNWRNIIVVLDTEENQKIKLDLNSTILIYLSKFVVFAFLRVLQYAHCL